MAEADPFAAACRRLDAARIVPGAPASRPMAPPADLATPVRWAASRLLPRLDALAPRRGPRPRPVAD